MNADEIANIDKFWSCRLMQYQDNRDASAQVILDLLSMFGLHKTKLKWLQIIEQTDAEGTENNS